MLHVWYTLSLEYKPVGWDKRVLDRTWIVASAPIRVSIHLFIATHPVRRVVADRLMREFRDVGERSELLACS